MAESDDFHENTHSTAYSINFYNREAANAHQLICLMPKNQLVSAHAGFEVRTMHGMELRGCLSLPVRLSIDSARYIAIADCPRFWTEQARGVEILVLANAMIDLANDQLCGSRCAHQRITKVECLRENKSFLKKYSSSRTALNWICWKPIKTEANGHCWNDKEKRAEKHFIEINQTRSVLWKPQLSSLL